MKKKVISTVLCAAMVASMFAGCGNKAADNSSAADNSADDFFLHLKIPPFSLIEKIVLLEHFFVLRYAQSVVLWLEYISVTSLCQYPHFIINPTIF